MSGADFPPNTTLGLSAERHVPISSPLRRFSVILAVLMMATSSFDLVLIIKAGGNFRFCQIAGLVLFLLALMRLRRQAGDPDPGWAVAVYVVVRSTPVYSRSDILAQKCRLLSLAGAERRHHVLVCAAFQ